MRNIILLFVIAASVAQAQQSSIQTYTQKSSIFQNLSKVRSNSAQKGLFSKNKDLDQKNLGNSPRGEIARFGGSEGTGGGDDVALEFRKSFDSALQTLRRRQPEVYKTLKVENLAQTAIQAKIFVVDETLDVELQKFIQSSTAVNNPDTQTIFINRKRWNAISEVDMKEAVSLHEVLSLKRIESTGNYAISAFCLGDSQAPGQKMDASFGTKSMALPTLPTDYQTISATQKESIVEAIFAAERQVTPFSCATLDETGNTLQTWETDFFVRFASPEYTGYLSATGQPQIQFAAPVDKNSAVVSQYYYIETDTTQTKVTRMIHRLEMRRDPKIVDLGTIVQPKKVSITLPNTVQWEICVPKNN